MGIELKKWLFVCAVWLPVLSMAQDQKIGDWLVTSAGEYQIAKVFNVANNTAGMLCSSVTNSCMPYVTFGLNCEGGSKYPVMLNSPVGAITTTGTCVVLEKVNYMFLDDATNTLAAFESGGEIGFVTPTKGGTFQVVRFSSTGATAAIRIVREAAAKNYNSTATAHPAAQQL